MSHIYPEIKIDRIKNPSRSFAVPIVGFLFKIILLIPVNIELFFLKMVQFGVSILNACNIFFRGRYWKMAYELNMGIMRLETSVNYYLWGLTDVYPGFSLTTSNFSLDIDFNKSPNRLLATPLLGVIFRLVMMIPYIIYRQVLALAAFLAILVSWVPVLFTGKYPEATYEIARDSVRVDQAASAYFLGMSDVYPSWWISMNHKIVKITLLIIASLLSLWSFVGNSPRSRMQQHAPLQKNYFMHTGQINPHYYTY